ncbi:hypothetical protein Q8F57_018530 [Paraburkholderia terrae]|uniref:hypothetical protein n=1 Tax=Paraburkholderia terrae TaxID=311230 RepID=UPI00296AD71B|nr:hypothetical protein [Paraburkholderia terrae]MDW3655158.1 hypothetical protein [Paraburkholderia terrae]
MQHVRQINAIDCGIAVAAMLSYQAYRAAARADPTPHADHGLTVREMKALLGRLTSSAWCETRKDHHVRLDRATLAKEWTCAIVIGRPGAEYGHWIAVERGVIYDPELDASIPLAEYSRRRWRVLRAVTRFL